VTSFSTPIRPTRISSNALLPAISISPNSGYAGAYIEVTGNQWPSNSLVLLALEDELGRSGILATTNASGDGTVETGFLYPTSQRWLSPGEYTILAYTGNGSRKTTTTFTVTSASTATEATTTPTVALVADAPSTATPTPLSEPTATPTPTPTPTVVEFQDWRGEYWDNPSLNGSPVLVRNDAAIVFDWGSGSPADGIPVDYFSARWSRSQYFEEGVYRFFLEVDDGARLTINGVRILDEWREGSPRTVFVDFALSAGIHQVQIDYYEQTERAVIRFWWER
jgi:hypothetical protein